jgi:ribosomal protein S18 acetylase RimI-like enzyme
VREAAFTIRRAVPADIADLIAMKRELAAADNTLVALRATPDDWRRDLFGDDPRFTAFVATRGGSNIGMAICSERYVTGWPGPTIYLQDLFVAVPHRRQGVGKALIDRVSTYAQERGSPIIELNMRADNPAGHFYARHGFEVVQNCTVYVAGTQALAQFGRVAVGK